MIALNFQTAIVVPLGGSQALKRDEQIDEKTFTKPNDNNYNNTPTTTRPRYNNHTSVGDQLASSKNLGTCQACCLVTSQSCCYCCRSLCRTRCGWAALLAGLFLGALGIGLILGLVLGSRLQGWWDGLF